MTTFNRDTEALVRASELHARKHQLDSAADHEGTLSESSVAFNATTGHFHNGTNSNKVDHVDLLSKGTLTHAQLESWQTDHLAAGNPHNVTTALIHAVSADKAIALPQTETTPLVNATHYQIQGLEVLVGHNGAPTPDDPNRFVTILSTDGELLMDQQGRQIQVSKLTNDAAGNNTVIGLNGGYADQPYAHFVDGAGVPFNPNRIIKVRYGTKNSMSALPEDVLLRESTFVGDTSAEMKSLIAQIKGTGRPYDDPLDMNTETLATLKAHVADLFTLVAPGGGGSGIVFETEVISKINASAEYPTTKILANHVADLAESQITNGALLARLADNETVTGSWSFSVGPVVEHGTTLPTGTIAAGRLFVKTDTKEVYAGFDGSTWAVTSSKLPGHFYKKEAAQWTITSLVGAVTGITLDLAHKNAISVWRGGMLQNMEDGHYTLTQSGNDVVVTFTDPVPANVSVIVKWSF